uniref:Envelope protein syncytin-Car1 n=1 Tax=Chelydra serpentina TaxID=8475 RepID=A0A8C3RML7_CHESE
MRGPFILTTVCFLLCLFSLFSAYEDNAFIRYSHEVKTRILGNRSNCWVCTQFPVNAEQGLPFTPIPLTTANMTWMPPARVKDPVQHNLTWDKTGVPINRYLRVTNQTGSLCFVKEKGSTFVGTSKCNMYFNGTAFSKNLGFKPCASHLSHMWIPHLDPTFSWVGKPSESAFKKPCSDHEGVQLIAKGYTIAFYNCSSSTTLPFENTTTKLCLCSSHNDPSALPGEQWSNGWWVTSYFEKWNTRNALYGTYWVGGPKAYYFLSPDWAGSCYLAWLTPPSRISLTPPHFPHVRNIRETFRDINIRDGLSWQRWAGLISLRGGVIRLQGLLESLTNETATLFENQAGEMSQLRQLALQNRMALDIMLAAQGGTCALINEECCVFVNDTYSDTFQRTKHLREMAKNYSSGQPPYDWWGALWNWLPGFGWVKKLLVGIVGAIVILIILCCCIQCVPSLIDSCGSVCSFPTSAKSLTLFELAQAEIAKRPLAP